MKTPTSGDRQMNKQERSEIEEAAKAAHGERWCLHPNGTSVWTGEEYQPDPNVGAPQYMVCKQVNPLDEAELRRMEFIAACSPAAVLDLLEFYGLSDTRIERGPEDNDEVCVVCGYATTEGHTHAQCFANGKSDGAHEENLRLAASLSVILGCEPMGYFDESLKQAAQLRADAITLTRALALHDGVMGQEFQDAFDRVVGRRGG